MQQNFGIRTAGLEEKATACQMLVCYARELKEAFAEYSEEVVKIMVPLLKFYFHDGILVHLGEREGREKGSARSKLLPPLRHRCLPRVSVLAGGRPLVSRKVFGSLDSF